MVKRKDSIEQLSKQQNACYTLHPAEAVSTAVYLRNRYEAWYNKQPSLQHLRIFGSPGYLHVGAPSSKLNEKNVKILFMGYSDTTKGYRVLNTGTGKITVSAHVTFNETSTTETDDPTIVESSPIINPVPTPSSQLELKTETVDPEYSDKPTSPTINIPPNSPVSSSYQLPRSPIFPSLGTSLLLHDA
jgi:hypothetical protein